MQNVTWKICLLIDSHGNRDYVVFGDSSESVQVSGLLNREGKPAYFESEAYHLGTWSAENDIKLKSIHFSEKFADLWSGQKIV